MRLHSPRLLVAAERGRRRHRLSRISRRPRPATVLQTVGLRLLGQRFVSHLLAGAPALPSTSGLTSTPFLLRARLGLSRRLVSHLAAGAPIVSHPLRGAPIVSHPLRGAPIISHPVRGALAVNER